MPRNLRAANSLDVSGTLKVTGSTTMYGDVTLGDNISDNVFVSGTLKNNGGASLTGSFSGSGANLNQLTSSNISNFTDDVRNKISGIGLISYNPSTGEISYTGAGGTIYTDGNITGSGGISDPIRTKNNITASTITASVGVSASYFYGDGSNLTGLMTDVYTAGNITGSGTVALPIGIIPNPTFTSVTSSYFTGSRANLDYIDFTDQTTDPPQLNGTLWHRTDSDYNELRMWTEVPDVHIKIGQQVVVRVHNGTGATIAKGSVVHLTGAVSPAVPRIAKADWTNDYLSANTLGVLNSTLNNGDEGYVVISGLIEGVDTNAFAEGDVLYLSGSGGFSNVKAVAPNHLVIIGQVIRQGNSSVGSIFVKVQNGYEIEELHDVLVTSPQNYDLLVRDTDGLWKNTKTLAGNYTFSGNNQFTGSLNGTASYANNADLFDGQDSSLFALKTDVTGALSSYAKLDAINTFSAAENIFNNNVTINGTASIAQLNTVNQTSLVVGDKYITILSGSSTHVQMDGAGILFGSGSSDPTTGDQSSVAHIVYRKGNAPSDFTSDYIEVYPQLRSAGIISGSNLTGSNTGDETTATIKSKLGSGSATTDGYISSADWTTFNNKLSSVTVGGNITGSGTSGSPLGTSLNPTFTTVTASTGFSGGTFTGTTVSASTGLTGSTLQIISQAEFDGGVKVAYSAKTNNYTLTASSDYVVSFSGSSLTGTLPNAANIQGTVLVVKNLHTSSVFVTSSTARIDGSTSGVFINGQYTSYTFLSDNTNWLII